MKDRDQMMLEQMYSDLSEKEPTLDLSQSILEAIPENTDYKEVAKAFAEIMKDYGTHLIPDFMDELHKQLNY